MYFDSFGIKYISQEILNLIEDKSITYNIFRIQFDNCTMCDFYCITFIEYMVVGRYLLDYTNLFSSNVYQNNDKIIYKLFNDKHFKRKLNP